MAHFPILIIMTLLNIVNAQNNQTTVSELDASDCGSVKGCWMTPPGCELDGNVDDCNEIIKWTQLDNALVIEMQATIDKSWPSFMGKYMSVAWSYDDKMGDDSVLECVWNPNNAVRSYISFNDGTHNDRLYNASKVMLFLRSGGVINNRLICVVQRLYKPTAQVDPVEAWRAFDLQKNDWTLQFARGLAKPRDDSMIIHWLSDGDLFPWVATEKASMKVSGNQAPSYIKSAKHYDIPRTAQYKMVVAHGILMLFGWWVFGAVALLFARYFKPMWPTKFWFGEKVWYQFHRNLFVISVILQVVGFILVFVQAGDWKSCTYQCDSKDYALYLHTILGVACTAGAIVQPFMAWVRPAADSSKRKIFNWMHWFVGIASWVLATVTIFISPPLGKSGLNRNFGRKADYLMAGYICSYILCSLGLELLICLSEKPKRKIAGKSEMPMDTIGGPPKAAGNPIGKSITSTPKFGMVRVIVLAAFALFAIAICAALSYMIEANLHFH